MTGSLSQVASQKDAVVNSVVEGVQGVQGQGEKVVNSVVQGVQGQGEKVVNSVVQRAAEAAKKAAENAVDSAGTVQGQGGGQVRT